MLQLQLDSGEMSGGFCDFAIEEFACASVSTFSQVLHPSTVRTQVSNTRPAGQKRPTTSFYLAPDSLKDI